MRRLVSVSLVSALGLAPLGVQAADLVVWWEEAWFAEEESAVDEMVAAFEQQTGKKIELISKQSGAGDEVQAALEAGQPPDFLRGLGGTTNRAEQWAYEGWLVDLDQTLGPLRGLFDADLLERATLLNARDGASGLYALPMGRITNHIHVWQSLLERAGFTLADIPRSGRRSGRSGATGSSRRCGEPPGARTSMP
jgi:ABC-type glycerol-3-phosphate transport system substrate-binding protein